MNAAQFFKCAQVDGRAVLQRRANTAWDDHGKWDDAHVPTLWLVRVFNRLLLVRDVDPALGKDHVMRFVAEDELVKSSGTGLRLCLNVVEDGDENLDDHGGAA